eukprot:360189_1
MTSWPVSWFYIRRNNATQYIMDEIDTLEKEKKLNEYESKQWTEFDSLTDDWPLIIMNSGCVWCGIPLLQRIKRLRPIHVQLMASRNKISCLVYFSTLVYLFGRNIRVHGERMTMMPADKAPNMEAL